MYVIGRGDILETPFEWQHMKPKPVIGVDEVGRGCLAGRVYAAAVIFKHKNNLEQFTDSKILSASRREELSKIILNEHHVGIGFASVDEVDKINIFQATFVAMKRAIAELKVTTGHVLVDGKFVIPSLKGFVQTPIIKGDLRAAPVSAASIVAKVTRDSYMARLGEKFPQYGFEQHKGYSTADHKSRIAQHGPCAEHRKTFRGVVEYI